MKEYESHEPDILPSLAVLLYQSLLDKHRILVGLVDLRDRRVQELREGPDIRITRSDYIDLVIFSYTKLDCQSMVRNY